MNMDTACGTDWPLGLESLVYLAVEMLPQKFPVLAAVEELPAFTSLPGLQVAVGSPCGQVLFCIATSALTVLGMLVT
ncbi:hypothetical protein EK904_013565 [Melospiza melodia maxima]|nr:hypothetical protein EK904_013565 [Melospiza melodia maxima]